MYKFKTSEIEIDFKCKYYYSFIILNIIIAFYTNIIHTNFVNLYLN